MSNPFKHIRSFLAPKKGKSRASFPELCALYEQRLSRWPAPASAAGESGRMGVLITPWISTAVPFFALECAMMLRRAGRTPVLLLDTTNLVQNAVDANHSELLRGLLRKNFASWEIHDAAVAAPHQSAGDGKLAATVFRENAIWRSRGEECAAGFMEKNQTVAAQIAAHLAQVRGLLLEAKPDRLLIPGGIFGLSALYVRLALELGIPFATFDGGSQALRLAQGGVAAHLADIPQAFAILDSQINPAERERMVATARTEIDDRMHVRDHLHYQLSAATGRDDLRYDLFIPLNIRWDSAALWRQRVFATVAEWLESVLEWVAARPGVSVCVRQHPRERLAFAKGSDDLLPLLKRFSSLGERLRFVKADEPLSSYDLMRHARVVLPHTSTVGIEAAILGKAVVLGTAVYYEDLGFCSKAETRDGYFKLIAQALEGKLAPAQEQRDDAALAYYLTQRCALMRTNFSAHPDDFCAWVKVASDELWSAPEAEDFRTGFLSGEPLSIIRHRRFSNARQS